MERVDVETFVKESPLSWRQAKEGYCTFLYGTSSMLEEVLGANHYVIIICDAPCEQYTSVLLQTFGGWNVRIAREEEITLSEENLMKIAEDDYRNRIEKYMSYTRYNNKIQ